MLIQVQPSLWLCTMDFPPLKVSQIPTSFCPGFSSICLLTPKDAKALGCLALEHPCLSMLNVYLNLLTQTSRASTKLMSRLQDPLEIFSVLMTEIEGGTMGPVRNQFVGVISQQHICTTCKRSSVKDIDFLFLPLYCPPRLI